MRALGTLGASVTAFFVLRRFVHWWLPIRICPSISLVFDGSDPSHGITVRALGTLGASVTAFFVLRRFVHWWLPLRPLVRVMDHPVGFTLLKCHLQGIGH